MSFSKKTKVYRTISLKIFLIWPEPKLLNLIPCICFTKIKHIIYVQPNWPNLVMHIWPCDSISISTTLYIYILYFLNYVLRKSTVLECQQRFDSWFCSVFQMCQSRIDNGRIFKGCRSAFSCEEECKKYGADCYCCHGYKCNFKTTGMLHWFPYSAEFWGNHELISRKLKI